MRPVDFNCFRPYSSCKEYRIAKIAHEKPKWLVMINKFAQLIMTRLIIFMWKKKFVCHDNAWTCNINVEKYTLWIEKFSVRKKDMF